MQNQNYTGYTVYNHTGYNIFITPCKQLSMNIVFFGIRAKAGTFCACKHGHWRVLDVKLTPDPHSCLHVCWREYLDVSLLLQLLCSDLGGARSPGCWGPSSGGWTGKFPFRGSAEDPRGRRLRTFPPGVPSLHKVREVYWPGEARRFPAAGWTRTQSGRAGRPEWAGRAGCYRGSWHKLCI